MLLKKIALFIFLFLETLSMCNIPWEQNKCFTRMALLSHRNNTLNNTRNSIFNQNILSKASNGPCISKKNK